MKRHLLLRLEAPLMSFGGVAIDNLGVSEAWPSASMIAGLLGNALGLRRTDENALQALQNRLVFACRADREGERLTDFQTADLNHGDVGWTTQGSPEGRTGGAGTYQGKHIRHRDYWADRIVLVALRLEPEDLKPGLDDMERALGGPARPLFIGRKPCLPAVPVFAGWSDGESALAALSRVPVREAGEPGRPLNAFAPARDDPYPFLEGQFREIRVSGARNWASDTNGGTQRWFEGRLAYPEGGSG